MRMYLYEGLMSEVLCVRVMCLKCMDIMEDAVIILIRTKLYAIA